MVFQPANDSDVSSANEVTRIRSFIRHSESLETKHSDGHILLVLDHAEARIFRTELKGTVPEMLTPYDPRGRKTHVHSAHDYEGPAEKPNDDAYFGHIADSIKNAEQILIFGSGTGSSATKDQFVKWLDTHHKPLAARILAAVTVDESHLTEAQLLAEARAIYESHQPVAAALHRES